MPQMISILRSTGWRIRRRRRTGRSPIRWCPPRSWRSPPECRQCRLRGSRGSVIRRPPRIRSNPVANHRFERVPFDHIDVAPDPIAQQVLDTDQIDQVEPSRRRIDRNEHVHSLSGGPRHALWSRTGRPRSPRAGATRAPAPSARRPHRLSSALDDGRFALTHQLECLANQLLVLVSLREPAATLRRMYTSSSGVSETFIPSPSPRGDLAPLPPGGRQR